MTRRLIAGFCVLIFLLQPISPSNAAETRRPQKITLSENSRTFERFILNVLLPIQTEETAGYSIESQSRRVCTVYGETRVSFYEIGTCILKVTVKETTKYLANSQLFYINVVAKPTPSASPTPTAADSLAGIRASAIANNTFYIDRGNCHSRGINAELQINEAGNWKRLVGAMGWEDFVNCPAAQPVQPWAAIDVPAGTTLRWRFWLPGLFDLNSATFMSLIKKAQTTTASATPTATVKPATTPTPSATPTVKPSASPTLILAAAVKVGGSCLKIGQAQQVGTKVFFCAKTKGKNLWRNATAAEKKAFLSDKLKTDLMAAKAAADAAAKAAADAAAKAAAVAFLHRFFPFVFAQKNTFVPTCWA